MSDEKKGLVLVVEDNREIAEVIGEFLRSAGYDFEMASDGITGLHLAVTKTYDVIVLDVMLPGMDGLQLCRKLRGDAKNSTPLLMLTARDTLDEKLQGLEAGADDYMVKPFELRELEARLRALLRRSRRLSSAETLVVGGLKFEKSTLKVTRDDKELSISPLGLRLLDVLMRESPRVVSRLEIEKEVWGDGMPDSDTLRSHMYNLRRVIDKPFAYPLLHTIPGMGYRLADLGPHVQHHENFG
jgi:DNA-binding response OmpR family regulator